MSIITFWNDDREQTGKTFSAVAVAIKMAIERELKILLISTSCNDKTMENCFVDANASTVKKIIGKNDNIAVDNGIMGIAKLIASNKLEPQAITDYTRVIFKNRLETISGYIPTDNLDYQEKMMAYEKVEKCYPDLIRLANQYYDIVIVDLDKQLNETVKKEIFEMSNLDVMVIRQRMESLNKYIELMNTNPEYKGLKHIMVVGKFHLNTKYNKKNVMRYLRVKDLYITPFNILFFEAAEEHNVVELFLKLKRLKDEDDENYIFMDEIQNIVDKILERLKELQKKMR